MLEEPSTLFFQLSAFDRAKGILAGALTITPPSPPAHRVPACAINLSANHATAAAVLLLCCELNFPPFRGLTHREARKHAKLHHRKVGLLKITTAVVGSCHIHIRSPARAECVAVAHRRGGCDVGLSEIMSSHTRAKLSPLTARLLP